MDGACAQGPSAQYGLTFASAEAEAAARAKAAAGALRPAYESAKLPPPPPPPTWAAGRNSARHVAGRLTEAEKAARLAEMTGAAAAHEEERWARSRREEGPAAAYAPEHHHSTQPAFLGAAERALFGAGTLAERVGARKHYNERLDGQ